MRSVAVALGLVFLAFLAFAERPQRALPAPTSAPAATAAAVRALVADDAPARLVASAPVAGPAVFEVPIPGLAPPATAELLPGSPRDYRAGQHEGIDFSAPVGTPVHAAAPGVVSRVDYAYQEWSESSRNASLDNARRLGYTPELVLDLIRGRQVWIDHGGGVVTRYAHLATVAALSRGDTVDATTVIGTVGSSGLPEGGPHLHFEIRIGDGYLGQGLDAAAVRAAVSRAFGR